jgi:hypothetical protein
MPRRAADLLGMTFGHWKATARIPGSRSGFGALWQCECVCGTIKTIGSYYLTAGKTKSCGCINRRVFEKSKICPGCKIEKPHFDFYPSSHHGVSIYCRPCMSEHSRGAYQSDAERRKHNGKISRQRLRQAVIDGYGGKCRCCGEGRHIFLALDHVHGGGNQETKIAGQAAVLRKVLQQGFPPEYQLLCHNCNWAKYHSKGNCPHHGPSWMPPVWGGFCASIG